MGKIALEANIAERTKGFFASRLIWDNHTCTTIKPHNGPAMADLYRHKAAGVDVVGLNVCFDPVPPENAVLLLADFRKWLYEHSQDFTLVRTAVDVHEARVDGKMAVFFNLEGANCLYGSTSLVSLYYDLGVRWMLFAYNHSNALAGGCQDVDNGLTEFGARVVKEMERVGMIVCCSHIGHRSAMDIMQVATKPVIFSHSNPRNVWDHPRNIRDEAIHACARTGGVVGINGFGVFLGDNDARVELIVKHIDYVVNLVGPQHVGIGLDYAYDQTEVDEFLRSHPETYPPEKYADGINMAGPERMPEIAERLLQLGYSEADTAGIMGSNFLRVAQQVWK